MQNKIDLRGMSFADVEDAMDLCAWLGDEFGQEYYPVRDSDLGYTVKRSHARPAAPKLPEQDTAILQEVAGKRSRPSLLGYMREYVALAAGLALLMAPYTLLGWLVHYIGLESTPPWLDWAKIAKGVQVGGLALTFWGATCLYRYFANVLLFTPDGLVYQKGLIARSVVQIRFGDIKSVSYRQTVLERLLGIGTLFLDSAATNGDVDIVFHAIDNPAAVREEVQRLIALGTP